LIYTVSKYARQYLSLEGKITVSYFDIVEGNPPCTGDMRIFLSLGFEKLVLSDSSILQIGDNRKLHGMFSISILK